MKKLLRVTGKGYKAVAVFAKADDGPTADTWTVETTTPILAWMRELDPAAIRQRLETQGASWEWEACPDGFDAGIDLWKRGVTGAIKQEQKKEYAKAKANQRQKREEQQLDLE